MTSAKAIAETEFRPSAIIIAVPGALPLREFTPAALF